VDKRVIAAVKQGQRAVWATGAWDEVAELTAGAGPKLLDRIGVEPGMDVLDVGTGSGISVAIPAALRGCSVTGVDLTPELFEHARRRAATAGVEVDWIEGDAEDLPVESDRFDRVLSTFGHICAPRHALAASELVRVCRRDGAIGFTSWTADSSPGRMFRLVSSYMPPPPDGVEDLVAWGDEKYVRALLEPHDLHVEFARETAPAEFDSLEAAVTFYEQKSGGLLLARSVLEPQGRWDDLHDNLGEVIADANVARGGRIRIEPEYLVTTAVWAAA
jgi:ubiquinone/menaquinone biosynthesis C-methylase UbiE